MRLSNLFSIKGITTFKTTKFTLELLIAVALTLIAYLTYENQKQFNQYQIELREKDIQVTAGKSLKELYNDTQMTALSLALMGTELIRADENAENLFENLATKLELLLLESQSFETEICSGESLNLSPKLVGVLNSYNLQSNSSSVRKKIFTLNPRISATEAGKLIRQEVVERLKPLSKAIIEYSSRGCIDNPKTD